MPKKKVLYYQTENLTILNDDILKTTAIEQGSVDLVVTSPPYNVDIQYNSHKDDVSYTEYLEFSEKWMTQCFNFLKADGRFCLNVPLDKNKGGQQSVGADFTTLAKKIGFKYHSTVIWNEGNISRRTAWGSWMSAKRYKQSDVTRDEFMAWTNGMWTFNGESKKRIGHPAPFPLELPRRCIKMFSYVGDTVLDPFMGSGTTLVASGQLGRRGIGVDVDKGYCKLAQARVEKEAGLVQSE